MADISKTSLKKLSHRKWETMRDLWMDHLPQIDFVKTYPSPTLWEFDASFPSVDSSGTAVCDQIAGVREAIFREAVLLSRKFIYCGSLLPVLANVGRETWTAATAYDTAFYAAKAFCYLLGFASLGRSSSLYLDAFLEAEERVGKQKRKVYKFKIHRMESRLTHQALWAMTQRLIDTTKFEGELQTIQTTLKLVDWDEISKFRNNIHYDGGYWPRSDQIANCDLIKKIPDAQDFPALWSLPSPVPTFADEYFHVGTLLRALLVCMWQGIADVAPAFSSEVDALNYANVPHLSVPITPV